MVDIRPFRGIRYNNRVISDVGKVLCPPYDVIGHAEQAKLYRRSPFNVIRLEAGKTQKNDTETSNAYTRALALLIGWQSSGVLVQETEPAFYLLQEEYQENESTQQRVGLFAAVHLEEFERGIVLPHEATRPGPKLDRLRLMQASDANISPLLALYRDPGTLSAFLAQQMESEPPDVITKDYSTNCRIWVLRDPHVLKTIQDCLASTPLYLADGHHRYETAISYRNMKRETDVVAGNSQAEPAHDFVLMCLEELSDPGLQLLSFHRLLYGLSPNQIRDLWNRISTMFEVQTIDRRVLGRSGADGLLSLINDSGFVRPTIGMIDVLKGQGFILRLREDLPSEILSDLPMSELSSCDAWLLHEGILNPVLDGNGDSISFAHNLEDLTVPGNGGGPQLVFLLNPMHLDLFEILVSQGQRLPPKTTYFAPKVPTGIVIHSLQGFV